MNARGLPGGVDWIAASAVRDDEAPAEAASRVLAGGALRAAAALSDRFRAVVLDCLGSSCARGLGRRA